MLFAVCVASVGMMSAEGISTMLNHAVMAIMRYRSPANRAMPCCDFIV